MTDEPPSFQIKTPPSALIISRRKASSRRVVSRPVYSTSHPALRIRAEACWVLTIWPVLTVILAVDDESKVRDAVDAAKGLMEAVPVYQDALQPAASKRAKRSKPWERL